MSAYTHQKLIHSQWWWKILSGYSINFHIDQTLYPWFLILKHILVHISVRKKSLCQSRSLLIVLRPDVICCCGDCLFLHLWCELVSRAASTLLQLLSWLPSPLLQRRSTTLALLISSRKTNTLTSDDALLYFRGEPTISGQLCQNWEETVAVLACAYASGCTCVYERLLLKQLSCSKKVRPRQGAFCLSAAAVSSFIELEFIIQPFFCVMSSRAGGRWRGREREGEEKRGGLATAQECVPIG